MSSSRKSQASPSQASARKTRKTDARNPVSYQMTQPMVMTVSNDRVRTRPDYRPDAAEARDGVFALLEDHELSAAEKARLGRGDQVRAAMAQGKSYAEAQASTTRPKRIWSPKEIYRYTIMLYKKLKPAEPMKERASQKTALNTKRTGASDG